MVYLTQVWDLQTQHCVQTCVGHRCEIWTLDYDESRRRLLSGSSDNVLRLWELRGNGQAKKEGGEEEEEGEYVVPLGSIIKTGSNDRTTLIRFHESTPLIGVLVRHGCPFTSCCLAFIYLVWLLLCSQFGSSIGS